MTTHICDLTPSGEQPEPGDLAAGPAALREVAAFYETVLKQSLSPDSDPRYCTAVRDIVMGLRRRADEVQAALPAPADRTALRDRIADAIRAAACPGNCGQTEEECTRQRIQPLVWHHGRLAVVEGTPEQFADAVLRELLPPTTADRDRIAEVIREFPFDDFGLDDVSYLLEAEPDTQEWVPKLADAVLGVLPAGSGDTAATRAAALLEEAARIRAHCPDHLDSDSADGAWLACHCAVADDMERRLADETQPEEPDRCPHGCDVSVCPCLACEATADEEAEIECANCWRKVENRGRPSMDGNHYVNWVHVPGGFQPCFPQRGADSPCAEPKPAAASAGVQTDEEANRVVAYRSTNGDILRCLRHAKAGLIGMELVPVASADLPDGGLCTFPDCGADVLIPQQTDEEA